MTRYIARFIRGGFPELYAVMDTHENAQIREPKPYHEANDEAGERNAGTWGKPEANVDFSPLAAWLGGTTLNTGGS